MEFEEEDNAPIDIDDDNYDNTDLLYEEDDEEYYDLCSSCDENTFALVQPCRHMICTNCVKNDNCQLCGFRKSNKITID